MKLNNQFYHPPSTHKWANCLESNKRPWLSLIEKKRHVNGYHGVYYFIDSAKVEASHSQFETIRVGDGVQNHRQRVQLAMVFKP